MIISWNIISGIILSVIFVAFFITIFVTCKKQGFRGYYKRYPKQIPIPVFCVLCAIGAIICYIWCIFGWPAINNWCSSSPVSSPSTAPSTAPSSAPSTAPSSAPSTAPTSAPSTAPTSAPSPAPTSAPSTAPTSAPSTAPTSAPSPAPTSAPSPAPTSAPSTAPTSAPSTAPTSAPSTAPSPAPTSAPSTAPSTGPTSAPSPAPTSAPSPAPTSAPISGPASCPGPVSSDIFPNNVSTKFNMLSGVGIGNFSNGFMFQWTNGGVDYRYIKFNEDGNVSYISPNDAPNPLQTCFNNLPVLEFYPDKYILNLDAKMSIGSDNDGIIKQTVMRPRIELEHNKVTNDYIGYNQIADYSFSGEFNFSTTTKFGKQLELNSTSPDMTGKNQTVVIFQIFDATVGTIVEVSLSYYGYAKSFPDCVSIGLGNDLPFVMVNYNVLDKKSAETNCKYFYLTRFSNDYGSFTLDVSVNEAEKLVISSAEVGGEKTSIEIPLEYVFNNNTNSESIYFKSGVYGQIPEDGNCYSGNYAPCTGDTSICSLEVFKSQLTYNG